MNVVAAYAPQAECNVDKKDKFWINFRDFTSTFSKHESTPLGEDINKHLRQKHDEECFHVFMGTEYATIKKNAYSNFRGAQSCYWRTRASRKMSILPSSPVENEISQ